MVLLDTDIVSFYLRGLHDLAAKVQGLGPARIHVSRVTHTELMVLVERREAGKISRRSVQNLMESVTFVDIDDAAWEMFPMIKARLMSAGKKVGDADILQGAVATTRGLAFVTHNRGHYEAIASVVPLQLEFWIDQP